MTYLERYLSGGHEQVWEELLDLGAAVRADPLYPDERAVARETMRRVRQNVELLIHKLTRIDFVVLPWDMVDNSTSPLQTHLRPVFGDEAVQTDHLILEGGSIRVFLRAPSPISP